MKSPITTFVWADLKLYAILFCTTLMSSSWIHIIWSHAVFTRMHVSLTDSNQNVSFMLLHNYVDCFFLWLFLQFLFIHWIFTLFLSLCSSLFQCVCTGERVSFFSLSKSKEKISTSPKTEEWIKHFNYLRILWMANRSVSALLPKMASLSLKPRCVITLINTKFVFGVILSGSRKSRSGLWQYAKRSVVLFLRLETPSISVWCVIKGVMTFYTCSLAFSVCLM